MTLTMTVYYDPAINLAPAPGKITSKLPRCELIISLIIVIAFSHPLLFSSIFGLRRYLLRYAMYKNSVAVDSPLVDFKPLI